MDGQDRTCTPRLAFWVATGMGWVVWMFSVVATMDDAWNQYDGDTHGSAGQEPVLQACIEFRGDHYDLLEGVIDLEKFCDLYEWFTVFQFVATIVCSFAAATLALAWFRPAASQRAPAPAVGLGGGLLMAIYAVLETMAFSLAMDMNDMVNDAIDTVPETFGLTKEYELGPTFWVAVAASVLALVLAITLMVSFQSAGDGPFYRCWPLTRKGTTAVGPVATEA